jgi:NAD(P)-dependent dehydrogenase (short-subunit alcohol dehydrogenase family)
LIVYSRARISCARRVYFESRRRRIVLPEVTHMKTKDAVVLVTGANRGLGKALVQAALAAGARRVYAGARAPSSLSEVVRQGEGRVVPLRIDLADSASLEAAAASAPDVTLLVNNAGVLASYNVLDSSREQISEDFATNVFGVLEVTKAFLPALERAGAAGSAAIVNVLSVVSLANMPALGGYSASKAAAFSVTQALRGDLAKKGISVHAALPGPIDTDMTRAMEMKKTSPEDVAKAILDGLERGIEDISPDPFADEVLATWKRDPKGVERQFANG